MKRVRITPMLLIAALSGCRSPRSESTTHSRPSATSASSTHASTASSAASAQRRRYQFSSRGSSLELKFSAASAEKTARFTQFDGSVEALELDARSLTVNFEITTDSIESTEPKLASEARSSRGLNSARFPKASFASSSVALGGALGATNTIHGQLSLCGVTRPVALPATIHLRSHDVDIDGEFSIEPRQFGCTRAIGTRSSLAGPWRVWLSLHAES